MSGANVWVKATRSMVGIALGYLIFVIGAWVVQEALLGGVGFHDDLTTILLAGILTPAAAAVGAIVTVSIAGRHPWLHLIPMFTLIVAETTYHAGSRRRAVMVRDCGRSVANCRRHNRSDGLGTDIEAPLDGSLQADRRPLSNLG